MVVKVAVVIVILHYIIWKPLMFRSMRITINHIVVVYMFITYAYLLTCTIFTFIIFYTRIMYYLTIRLYMYINSCRINVAHDVSTYSNVCSESPCVSYTYSYYIYALSYMHSS